MALPFNINPQMLAAFGRGLASGNSPVEQIANGLNSVGDARAVQGQRNKTLEFLSQSPEISQMVQAGVLSPGDGLKALLQQQNETRKAQMPNRKFQTLADGTYGFSDENAGTWAPMGKAVKDPKESRQNLVNAGDGRLYDPNENKWITAPAGAPGGAGFKTELDTMKTYRAEDDVKTYREVRNSYERVRAGAGLNNAQGDLGLIFGYMKMLDPGSVVREGEFANAQNSGGVSETVMNMYNRVLNGGRLSPELREKFVTAADALYQQSAGNLESTNSMYGGLASDHGIPTNRFMVQPEKYEPLAVGKKTQVTVGGKPATITKIED